MASYRLLLGLGTAQVAIIGALLSAGAVYAGLYVHASYTVAQMRADMGELFDLETYRHLSPTHVVQRVEAFAAAHDGTVDRSLMAVELTRGAPNISANEKLASAARNQEGAQFTLSLRAPVEATTFFVTAEGVLEESTTFKADPTFVSVGVWRPTPKAADTPEAPKKTQTAMPPVGMGALNTVLEAMNAHRKADQALRAGTRWRGLEGHIDKVRQAAAQTAPMLGVSGPGVTTKYADLLRLLDRAHQGDEQAKAEYLIQREDGIAAMRGFLDSRGIFTPPFE